MPKTVERLVGGKSALPHMILATLIRTLEAGDTAEVAESFEREVPEIADGNGRAAALSHAMKLAEKRTKTGITRLLLPSTASSITWWLRAI